jgi:hypothetical protein
MSKLIPILWQMGLHIGMYNYLTIPESYKYILGIRNNIAIFDLQQIYHQIRIATSFLYHLGRQYSFLLFTHSTIENMPVYVKLFLIHVINIQQRQAFTELKWSYGQLSNAFTQIQLLLTIIYYLDVKASKKRRRRSIKHSEGYNFYQLMQHLLFFTIYKRLEGVSWLDTYNSVARYWRMFYFFKFYSFLRDIPDALLYINNNNNILPTVEAETSQIPAVVVGSNAITMHASYVITSNTISYVIGVFYFMLFISSFKYGLSQVITELGKHPDSSYNFFIDFFTTKDTYLDRGLEDLRRFDKNRRKFKKAQSEIKRINKNKTTNKLNTQTRIQPSQIKTSV